MTTPSTIAAVREAIASDASADPRSTDVDRFLTRIATIDPERMPEPAALRTLWRRA